ncbi:hypothetical protein Mal4_37550 [Maioricimonas rarisocia]|uniref:Uncharacterized protein n=1 Tax=Maioricimonas rarisocia TaxID=2528026 RepID=A0A517ZAE5_9PLAN|nr:hypothetical protein [Maioricimonas rarisocia]QDU39410.1 hypothetical protein Mal4_37550 [Maioricimonas rarisocia]
MKHSKTKLVYAVFGIVAVVIAVNIAIRWETPKPEKLTIAVTGTEGRAVEAKIQADGSERTLEGTIPAEFAIEAHQLSWEVTRIDGPAKEKFQVAVHSPSVKNWGGSAEDFKVVRGGSIGPTGLRHKRAWLGRLHE